MSIRINNSQISSQRNNNKVYNESTVGVVVSVVLNDSNDYLRNTDFEEYSSGKLTSDIGGCAIRTQGDNISSEQELIIYKPLDPTDVSVPLVGETVRLINVGNTKYYQRINSGFLNISNAEENKNKISFAKTENPTNTAASYSATSQTGISNSSNISDRDTKIGEYFNQTQINNLILYEGDKLIQSRFGQSIRFSGYNNPDNEFSPTIHIRNRQNDVSLNELKEGDLTEEDVNRDGSTILMTSGQYLIPFQPGVIDDGGSSDFETKPEVFADYPSELKGTDQVLINSGRIILSSKDSEMIFYSKGNYGFISDGVFSIDNGKEGANMNFNGDVRITTNDNNFYILGDTGNIYLNIENKDEPLVRGNTLKDLMERLIDLIVRQVYQTPSGPTAVGPTNQADFKKLRSELSTMLSTLNFTE